MEWEVYFLGVSAVFSAGLLHWGDFALALSPGTLATSGDALGCHRQGEGCRRSGGLGPEVLLSGGRGRPLHKVLPCGFKPASIFHPAVPRKS